MRGSNLWKEVHPLRLRSLHRSATTTISPTETGLSNPSIATKLDARYGCVNMAKITKASGQSGMPVPRKGRCGILIIGQSYCGIPGSRVCSTKPSDLRQAFAKSMLELRNRMTLSGSSRATENALTARPRMAKKLNLQESRVVISCLYSLTACRPVEF
jgi:hypothetical protein